MTAFLDIPTMVTVAVVTSICAAIAMGLIWGSNRHRSVGLWATSYVLMAVSSVLTVLRGDIPAIVSITFANCLLLSGVGITWLGFRSFLGEERPGDRIVALAGAAAWFLFTVNQAQLPSINSRTALLSALVMSYCVMVTCGLWRARRRVAVPALYAAAAIYATHGVMQFLRLAGALTRPIAVDSVGLPQSPWIAFVIMEAIMSIAFSGMAILALCTQVAERKLRIAAETDDLTGVYNRRTFLQRVVPLVAGSEGQGALLIFDLDHFKSVNDTYGHAAGDKALVAFSRCVSEGIASRDLFARIGGEEFALFLPGADGASAKATADRICLEVATLRTYADGRPIPLGVSCGIAAVREAGTQFELLHRAADLALYAAKDAGRSRAVLFDKAAHLRSINWPTDFDRDIVMI